MNAVMQRNSVFENMRSTQSITGNVIYNVPFTKDGVRIFSHGSSWVKELESRFNELTSLEIGWDGYAGRPVSFTCAVFAANLLERICIENVSVPSLVPGSDGTLQIEWHENQYDIEIDILGAHNVVATRFDLTTEQEETFNLQSDFSVLADWVSDLAVERDLPQQEIA